MPVTPTKGSKRMAVGTPGRADSRAHAQACTPVGFAAASALEQILAAIAGVERKLDARFAALAADAEEREKRIAAKFLVVDAMEDEVRRKGHWEV